MTLQDRLRALYVENGTNYVQEAADEIDRLTAECERLREALVEARRWIGDGDLGDGFHRDIWTPRYRAAVDKVDAALAARKQT